MIKNPPSLAPDGRIGLNILQRPPANLITLGAPDLLNGDVRLAVGQLNLLLAVEAGQLDDHGERAVLDQDEGFLPRAADVVRYCLERYALGYEQGRHHVLGLAA